LKGSTGTVHGQSWVKPKEALTDYDLQITTGKVLEKSQMPVLSLYAKAVLSSDSE